MMYPEILGFSAEELALFSEEFRKNNFIDPEISEQLGVKRGLRNPDGTGVLAGLTNICDVIGYERNLTGDIIPIDGKLIYRGIDLQVLVDEAIKNDRFMFEETAWLLLFGSLPNKDTLNRFREILEHHRELPNGFAETMIMSAPSPNIMNKMARSVLAMYSYDDNPDDTSVENLIEQSVNMIAQLPTMMVYAYQTKLHAYDHGSLYFHYPIHGLSTAEHILATYRPDQNYTREEAKLLDLCMVVHADHGGGNNSTFADRVLSSTGTDTYSAISAAICALKGPRHGGANLKVMAQLDEISSRLSENWTDEEMKAYLRRIIRKQASDGSGLIYGIGHAVYTKSDPRAQILKNQCRSLAYEKGLGRDYELLCAIERLAPEVFREEKGGTKNVCANMDLFSGLVYRILGISEELYTPIFAISRVAGWCAHRMEEVEFANRIIRPAYKYVGKDQKFMSIDERK